MSQAGNVTEDVLELRDTPPAVASTLPSNTVATERSWRYGAFVAARVHSHESRDPLYSGVHLDTLSEYLQKRSDDAQSPLDNNFVWLHDLSENATPGATPYNSCIQFESRPRQSSRPEILFLSGKPSPQWLNCIGNFYRLDPEYFFQHMRFLPSVTRQSYFEPGTRSATAYTLRLCIPTIVFVGNTGRSVPKEELFKSRNLIEYQLRNQFNELKRALDAQAKVGSPLFRRINIHRGDLLTVEQELTMTVLRHKAPKSQGSSRMTDNAITSSEDNFTILVWSDCNGDGRKLEVLLPDCPSFQEKNLEVSFCPVIMDRYNIRQQLEQVPKAPLINIAELKKSQTLSLLPSHYGIGLDRNIASEEPFYAILELFQFAACAISQFLEMLTEVIEMHLEQFRIPPQEVNELPDAMTFHYNRTVLERCRSQLDEAIETLETSGGQSWSGVGMQENHAGPRPGFDHTRVLLRDFQTLARRAQSLVAKCDQGLTVVRDHESVTISRRAVDQTDSVNALTRITTAVTVLYVPVSFVTSIFGMNFRQFGQGTLSIWWWAACSGPILATSVFLWRLPRQWVIDALAELAFLTRHANEVYLKPAAALLPRCSDRNSQSARFNRSIGQPQSNDSEPV